MSNAKQTDRIMSNMRARQYRQVIAQHMNTLATTETAQDVARAARRAEFARLMGQTVRA